MQNTIIRSNETAKWLSKYGNWAVVTGASDGVGREMARRLAQTGLNLVLIARRKALLDQLATELTAMYGVETRVIDADLSNMEAVHTAMSATQDLDVGLLIACAGFGTSGRFIDADLEREVSMLDVNCRAVLAMAQHFGRRFAARRRGGIVLMSSLLAFQGVPFAAHYAATKAYVQSLAEGLHFELAPYGVDVIASAPGPIHTGFAERADMQMSRAATPDVVAQETLKALGHATTIRPGRLSKLLEAALAPAPRWGRVYAMARIMRGMLKQAI